MSEKIVILYRFSLERVYFSETVDDRVWVVGRRGSAHTYICTRCACGGTLIALINPTFHANHSALCEDGCNETAHVPEAVFGRALGLLDGREGRSFQQAERLLLRT